MREANLREALQDLSCAKCLNHGCCFSLEHHHQSLSSCCSQSACCHLCYRWCVLTAPEARGTQFILDMARQSCHNRSNPTYMVSSTHLRAPYFVALYIGNRGSARQVLVTFSLLSSRLLPHVSPSSIPGWACSS